MNDLWRLWAAFLILLMAGIAVRADDPFKVASKGDPFKVTKSWVDPFKLAKKACQCEGEPQLCICSVCSCANGSSCRVAVKPLPPAPKATFKHDCGCPSLSCNCGAGGCHCAENRVDNRQSERWYKSDGVWILYRGTQQLGGVNSEGIYRPFDVHSQTWGSPCKPPIPLPTEQTKTQSVQSSPACST